MKRYVLKASLYRQHSIITFTAWRIANSLRLYACVLCAFAACGDCAGVTLESPDGQLVLEVQLPEKDGRSSVGYTLRYDGEQVIGRSTIGFVRENGAVVGRQLSSRSEPVVTSRDSEWTPVYGERRIISDQFNQLSLQLYDEAATCEMELVFRCYDEGVAFRVVLSDNEASGSLRISEEQSEFCFLDDHLAWCTAAAQGEYKVKRLSDIRGPVERPLTIQVNDDLYVAIAEAALVDYARMLLIGSQDKRNCLVSRLSSRVQAHGDLATPWRVIMVAKSPGELLENNDIILNLNAPCAIADTSWIKPGKVLREITLTTEGAMACIDFARDFDIQFVEFDAGWYGAEDNDASDATTVTLDPKRSRGPLDLKQVIDYANKQGVGIILYVNRRALEKQLDEILPLYKEWGVAGVKYGFVQVGSQKWTSWLHEAVRKAADHQLMVDVHDEYRPTGYSRTYPNLMTTEGVRGDEASASSSQAITTLFTRNLAGASDRTVCYFDPRVDRLWSHGHQLAKAVCNYSPWQFIFWYDTVLPGAGGGRTIANTPELEFFKHLPTSWDDTRVLHGEIGQYAVFARRFEQEWYVGAMNGQDARSLEICFDFLTPEQKYLARIYSDDPTVESVTKVNVHQMHVSNDSTLRLDLQSNGGQAIRLTPVADEGSTAIAR